MVDIGRLSELFCDVVYCVSLTTAAQNHERADMSSCYRLVTCWFGLAYCVLRVFLTKVAYLRISFVFAFGVDIFLECCEFGCTVSVKSTAWTDSSPKLAFVCYTLQNSDGGRDAQWYVPIVAQW